MRTQIIGTGSELPPKVVGNDALARSLGVSESWIVERTGVRERRVAGAEVCTSDLAAAAGRRALELAGVRPEELDLIIVATITGDMPTPATAAFVQAKLGATRAFAFDLGAACTGGLYALSVADQFIRTGQARRALVIGAEILSRVLDWQDPATCVIFADGAGAAVLAPCEEPGRGILGQHFGNDGALAEILAIPGPGSRHPLGPETLAEGLHTVRMNGREVYRAAVRAMVSTARQLAAEQGVEISQVQRVITHQANLRIIEAALDRLGVPLERAWLNIDRCGNTSAASLLIALDEANRAGTLARGDLLMLLAVGAGFSWGSMLARW